MWVCVPAILKTLQKGHFKKISSRKWGVVASLTDPDPKLLIQYHELTKSFIGIVDTNLQSMVLLGSGPINLIEAFKPV